MRAFVAPCALAVTWACGNFTEPEPPPGEGAIQATTATTGTNLDPDGYSLVVDDGAAQPIGTNATDTLSDLAPGDHSIRLTQVASNCKVTDPQRSVTVPPGATVATSFQVTCLASAGAIEVTTATSGFAIDPDGYGVSVDGGASQPIGVNGAATFPGLTPGAHSVLLSGAAANCSVSDNPQTATVTVGETAPASFSVSCTDGALHNEILFLSTRDGSDTEIYVMNADGSNVRQLTNNSVNDQDIAAAPNGQKFAFSRFEGGHFQIYVMNADGSSPTKLSNNSTVDDTDPEWSPDGSMIAFESDRANGPNVWIMNSNGTGLPLQRTQDGNENGDVDWSPDGSKIVYECHSGPMTASNVCLISAAGSEPPVVLMANAADPAWSPDGDKIAFGRNQGGGKVDIWTMNADGSGAAPLTASGAANRAPTWSPDGSRIAFHTNRGGNDDVFTMSSADGSGLTQLTTNGAFDGFPEWSRNEPLFAAGSLIASRSVRLSSSSSRSAVAPNPLGR